MTRLAADMQWLRRVGALTVEPEGEGEPHDHDRCRDQIVVARLRVVRLVCAARGVAGSPDAGRACGPVAAALVDELARADVPEFPPLDTHTPSHLAEWYEQALCDAASAVYYCRRTEHASGRCLFSPAGPSADLCGRVLTAGHRYAWSR